MHKKWKIVFGVLLLLAAGLFIITQFLETPEVEVREAIPTNIKRSFSEEATITPRQERTIYAIHTARIEKLLVKEGSQVNAGDPIAVLDDSELQYSLQELKANLDILEGERRHLEEEPGQTQIESYQLRADEAREVLEAARRSLERIDSLYLESYELRVNEAQESLKTAENNYNRVKNLFEEDIVSLVEYETAREKVSQAENYLAQREQELQIFVEAEYEEAEELVKKAEYNLAQQEKALQILHESHQPSQGSRDSIEAQKRAVHAKMDLIEYQMGYYRLEAPISGTISFLEMGEGELVQPQVPLAKLFQDGDWQVETRVLTSDVHDIYPGMQVELLLEIRDEEIRFAGKVEEISPYAQESLSPLGLEEERVKITINPEIPEDIVLAPGYKLDVDFTTEELSGVLVAPKTALFPYQGEDALLVVENGQTRIQTVQTGMETRQDIVVTEGLEEGALFILDPQLSGVEEGTAVTYTIINEKE